MSIPIPDARGLLLYCRPGFEKEAAAEIQAQMEYLGESGYVRTRAQQGFVEWIATIPWQPARIRGLYPQLIFARQLLVLCGHLTDLSPLDRLTPVLSALPRQQRFREVVLETDDSNEGKQLSRLLKSFRIPLEQALKKQGQLKADPALPRLHLFFISGTDIRLGLSEDDNSSPWPMGIPRLRMPGSAPSRSTLKLDEAILTLLTKEECERWLKPGMRAVDLGAAPGGWTWQLVKRGLSVIAIDNGAMNTELMASGMVEHRRADGFHFKPQKPVDWMVCDMVEQPSRIAALVADWMTAPYARGCIFNLKLPMKKRYEEVQRCLSLLQSRFDTTGRPFLLRGKQLFHDREEITCLAYALPTR